jgi:peptidoglycan/LPS O-acetylase OafA/YrhL
MKYRPEIDGLRSVAVIAVIVFHMDKIWLPGGFLGVDIFFTISGYLISLMILRECAHDQFDIWTFWKRRVKRLVPALFHVGANETFGKWLRQQQMIGNFPKLLPIYSSLPPCENTLSFLFIPQQNYRR